MSRRRLFGVLLLVFVIVVIFVIVIIALSRNDQERIQAGQKYYIYGLVQDVFFDSAGNDVYLVNNDTGYMVLGSGFQVLTINFGCGHTQNIAINNFSQRRRGVRADLYGVINGEIANFRLRSSNEFIYLYKELYRRRTVDSESGTITYTTDYNVVVAVFHRSPPPRKGGT